MLNETVINVLDSVNAIVENAGGNRLVVFNQATAVRLSKCSFTTLRKFLKVVKTETYTLWKEAAYRGDEGKRNWYQINWDDVMEEYETAVLKTQGDLEKLLSYDSMKGLV